MNRNAFRFFALSIVFLAVTVTFYESSGVSLAKYLIFVLNGFAAGASTASGIASLRKNKDH